MTLTLYKKNGKRDEKFVGWVEERNPAIAAASI
jgi:hypothetical protein